MLAFRVIAFIRVPLYVESSGFPFNPEVGEYANCVWAYSKIKKGKISVISVWINGIANMFQQNHSIVKFLGKRMLKSFEEFSPLKEVIAFTQNKTVVEITLQQTNK
ncbi:MAG: hypothetical protein ACTHKY_10485 [Ginsengibacter sp.]